MCTLIVLDRIVPGCPLLVAANRDEFFSRPASPPVRFERREKGQIAFVAPQDLEAGGTWMGLNTEGLFVGLTNRVHTRETEGKSSRGLLVMDTLGQPSAKAAAEAIGEIEEGLEDTYNPFYLLYADGESSFLTALGEDGVRTRALDPGVQVVSNRDEPNSDRGKVGRIRELVAAIDLGAPLCQIIEDLAEVLRSHGDELNPLQHVCVHTPGYGTRSSALLALAAERWRYWHSEGPPCEAKYRNYTRLLDGLR